tara:strand:+ start:837 stop:1109 length:273 start_codon:yes stop_codon:yes gene_type:complete
MMSDKGKRRREKFLKKIQSDSFKLKNLINDFGKGIKSLGYTDEGDESEGLALFEASHHKLDTILFLMDSIKADMQDSYALDELTDEEDFN